MPDHRGAVVLWGGFTMAVPRPTRSCRGRRIMRAARSLAVAVAWLIPLVSSLYSAAAEPHPRSILVLAQAETTSPFYGAIYAGLRSTVTEDRNAPVSVYVESLDLDRFTGPGYEASLTSHLRIKYADRPPGVLVAVGAASLQLVLRLRSELWPEAPVVFSMVDEPTFNRLSPGPAVTGNTLRLRFSDMMTVARSLVPKLKHIALVGDAWDNQTVFRHFREEIPAATAGVEVIDLVGLPLAEVRRRVASLPEATVILYTAMYSDGAGTSLLAREALSRFAEVANAPVVGAAETFLGAGVTGGFVMLPSIIGSSAGRIALRILNGEDTSQIPVTMVDGVRPVFDWRQMQRWRVRESKPSRGQRDPVPGAQRLGALPVADRGDRRSDPASSLVDRRTVISTPASTGGGARRSPADG